MGYKLGYNNSGKYVTCSNGIYYFIRRVPTDLSDQYKSNKIKLSLRTRNPSKANRCARSITQRLDDYCLGLVYSKALCIFQKVTLPFSCFAKTITLDGPVFS